MKKLVLITFSTIIFAVSAFAQANLVVYNAELSVPFGEANGKIIAVGEQIIFVDNDKPEGSFAIARSNLASINSNDQILTIETKQAVADRSGMKSRFVIRVSDDGASKIESWVKSNAGFSAGTMTNASTNTASTVVSGVNRSGMNYEAEHKHTLYGSCTGRLIVGDDRISYESLDDRDHSRQWLFNDIKKIKRKSPYKFEVQLLKGDGYSLEILGQGIDINDFKAMENLITTAKSSR